MTLVFGKPFTGAQGDKKGVLEGGHIFSEVG